MRETVHIKKRTINRTFCGLNIFNKKLYKTMSQLKAESLSAWEYSEENGCDECMEALSVMHNNTIR